MGYRLRYTFSVDFVPSGTNPGYSPSGTTLPFTGNAQTLTFFNNPSNGQYSGTFTGGDITTLTNAMAADAVVQLTAAETRVQGFATGGG